MEDHELIDQELERVALSVGIPPCPRILAELSAEVKKEGPDFNYIEKLFCSDVGLSAALIHTINSPFFEIKNKVTTIAQAVNSIGLSTLSRVLAGMVLRHTFDGIRTVSMERFNDASSKVAIASAHIAQQLDGVDKDEAYTYGLFQDCGIPVLINRHPDYKATLKRANQTADRKFTEIEDVAHGANHATIGYLLAKSWSLPEAITNAIRFHHEYSLLDAHSTLPMESQNLIAIGLLAERSIQLDTGLNSTVEWAKGGITVLQHFGLSDTDFNRLMESVMEAFETEGISCRNLLDIG